MKNTLLSFLLSSFLYSAEKPQNIVFILVDDLGATDVNLDGTDPFYETPNLAKFAKSAVHFTNGYASGPVCSPTRSAILTGQNPARTKNSDYFGAPNQFIDAIPDESHPLRNSPELAEKLGKSYSSPIWPAPYLGRLPDHTTTLAQIFKKHGYTTFFAGKWHLGTKGHYPQDHGFDTNLGGGENGTPNTGGKYFSPYKNPSLEDGPSGEYLTERLGRETANFIKANTDKQFFAYLSFYAVHTPLMAPANLVKKYAAKRKKLRLGNTFAPEPPRENRTIHSHATYAAMIESMDAACGQVFDALEETGLAKNTIVVFTSDNGGLSTSKGAPTSNLPYRAGKGWLYEGGIRVPVLVRNPSTKHGGQTCKEPIYSTDYYPTLLAATGHSLTPDQHKDGISFLPYLENPSAIASNRPMFWHYPHWGNQGGSPSTAIRAGKWKLIHWQWPKRTELYDLEADPGEINNLSAAEPNVVSELSKKIEVFLSDTMALQATINPNIKHAED